ncbi:MAG TPA: dTDP-4-dehydrorhamnose 3,5-epimerase [Egibacteraceae bacterium]|nr:dTDP-4-dehydrorhamnose 3,5-epimerase [Egibacteraceae bacterium]
MRFRETALAGVLVVQPEPVRDERGLFARTWDRQLFAARGLETALAQCSVSFNRRRGTLRGMHFQAAPHGEAKLVRCTAGGVYDVVIDLRAGSPTRGRWHAVELTAENRYGLYVPPGCAHGFLTLVGNTEVFYQISEFYHPEASRGVRWDDPAFAVVWPERPAVLSERDATYPDYAG